MTGARIAVLETEMTINQEDVVPKQKEVYDFAELLRNPVDEAEVIENSIVEVLPDELEAKENVETIEKKRDAYPVTVSNVIQKNKPLY